MTGLDRDSLWNAGEVRISIHSLDGSVDKILSSAVTICNKAIKAVLEEEVGKE